MGAGHGDGKALAKRESGARRHGRFDPTMPASPGPAPDRLNVQSPRGFPWPVLLLLAVPVLLPLGRAAELAVLAAALAGCILALQGRLRMAGAGMPLVLLLLACYWLPALGSAPFAVAPGKTWSTVAATLRFLPFAAFVVWALRDRESWPRLRMAVAAIVLLWVLDAAVQMLTGYGLRGAAEAERISGIFGADNLKLGPVLAVLSPFFLLAARERLGRGGLLLAIIVLAVPVALAGARAGWLAYALVCALVGWREAGSLRRFLAGCAVAVLALGLFGYVALQVSPRLEARVARSLQALHGTEAGLDEALAGRLRIWHAAAGMLRAHPLLGVGVRGFRHAYAAHALPGDEWVDAKTGLGAAHPHQIVLEVLTETGAIGFAFWCTGAWFAWLAWRRAGASARERARAPALALLAMCFPLNTHLAFYSAWWGLLFWWLLALYCAALGARAGGGAGAR